MYSLVDRKTMFTESDSLANGEYKNDILLIHFNIIKCTYQMNHMKIKDMGWLLSQNESDLIICMFSS